MDLYIKQKVFSWKDKFSVYDQNGDSRYYVEGEVFSIGKKLHLFDMGGNELAFIHQKVLSFLPKYFININGSDVAEVVKNITFFKQQYEVRGFGWTVIGDFFAHEYEICSGDTVIARVSKEWFTFGDAYHISIVDGVDERAVLSVILIIDACLASQDNNVSIKFGN